MKTLPIVSLAAVLAGCSTAPPPPAEKKAPEPKLVTRQPFGVTPDGKAVERFDLRNTNGVEASVITYGAIVSHLKTPDRGGKMADIVFGFDSLDGYLKEHPYIGAIVGRYGNRIGKGRFTLNGVTYNLAVNNGTTSLHGGLKGFDKVVWSGRELSVQDGAAVELTYLSKDGEEGYPGNLTAKVIYTLTNRNELRIDYEVTTDKDTVQNLTSHGYFNLAGQGEGDILSHQVTINASRFTPVDSALIPSGVLQKVEGTPFDFRTPHAIGERINAKDRQIVLGKGYDHNYVIDGEAGVLRPAAAVTESTSGRVMEVLTTEPGMQFYTGNFLDGSLTGKGGKVYRHRYGFCMETQHFPDSPNKPQFPTTVLKPGQTYRSTTIYRFSAR